MTASKNLHKLTRSEFGQLFPITISEYSDNWPELFEIERKSIEIAFESSGIVRIDHIGSTAIPGLKAKPTIDILLQVSAQIDIRKLEKVFESLGYHLTKQPDNPPPHMTFVKGYTEQGFSGQAYHVHIRYEGDWNELRFKEYLIFHEEIAREYEELKLELAVKFRNDREAYTDSKTEFIERIIDLIRTESTL